MNASKIHNKLLQLRDELTELVQTSNEAAATVELDQTRQGRLSRMDAMQAQAMSVEAQRRRQVKLRQIEAALRRVADDSFGDCQECGDAIAAGRLEYDPTTTLCIACASASEESPRPR